MNISSMASRYCNRSPARSLSFRLSKSIQEFKVEVNSPPAEFGRFNGGVVNLTTKSGTNDFHGSVFEFREERSAERSQLYSRPPLPANPNKPVFRRNQFGFVVGGPIVKDKTFFFGDYQGTRQLIARVRISTVPTLAQRSGKLLVQSGRLVVLTTERFDQYDCHRQSGQRYGHERQHDPGARWPDLPSFRSSCLRRQSHPDKYFRSGRGTRYCSAIHSRPRAERQTTLPGSATSPTIRTSLTFVSITASRRTTSSSAASLMRKTSPAR